jgi:hypothetical protein
VPGSKDFCRLVFGSRIRLNPSRIGDAAGPGTHGLCGADAAKPALAHYWSLGPRSDPLRNLGIDRLIEEIGGHFGPIRAPSPGPLVGA